MLLICIAVLASLDSGIEISWFKSLSIHTNFSFVLQLHLNEAGAIHETDVVYPDELTGALNHACKAG